MKRCLRRRVEASVQDASGPSIDKLDASGLSNVRAWLDARPTNERCLVVADRLVDLAAAELTSPDGDAVRVRDALDLGLEVARLISRGGDPTGGAELGGARADLLAACETVRRALSRTGGEKVIAFVTRNDSLLVARQVQRPDVALHVPQGTVEPGEEVVVAAVREAGEETGIDSLRVIRALGVRHWRAPGRGWALHHGFHLTTDEALPETWEHDELFPSEGDPVTFAFLWLPVGEALGQIWPDHATFGDVS